MDGGDPIAGVCDLLDVGECNFKWLKKLVIHDAEEEVELDSSCGEENGMNLFFFCLYLEFEGVGERTGESNPRAEICGERGLVESVDKKHSGALEGQLGGDSSTLFDSRLRLMNGMYAFSLIS